MKGMRKRHPGVVFRLSLIAFSLVFGFCLTPFLRAADNTAASEKDSKAKAQQLAQQLQQEKDLEIQEKKILADQHLEAGHQFYRSKNFTQAKNEYQMAYDLDSTLDVKDLMEKCDEQIVKEKKASISQQCREGIRYYGDSNYQAAIECFNKVLAQDPQNEKALEYKRKAEKALSTLDAGSKAAHIVGREMAEKADVFYEEGVRLYKDGNFDSAAERFKSAIAANPYHIPARRYLEIINERKNEYSRRDEQLAEEKAMYDVRQAWLPPSKNLLSSEAKKKIYKKSDVKTKQQLIMEEKAKQIVPEINFTDAHLRDVVKYLSKISGVNIILDEDLFKHAEAGVPAAMDVSQPKTSSATGISEDNFFDEENKDAAAGAAGTSAAAPAAAAAPAVVSAPVAAAPDRSDKITISLTNIPLIEALKYILTTKGLKYRIDDYAILVSTPERLMDVEMETRFYHLSSGAGDFVQFESKDGAASGGSSAKTEDALSAGVMKPKEFMSIKDVLENSGVPFPPGSKIFLDRKTGTLLVRNTPTNLALIEDILRTLDVSPFQIAIQAKFIEISQTDAKELGFDWVMKSWNVKDKAGPNSKGSVDVTGSDMTRGLRFFGNKDATIPFSLNGENYGGISQSSIRDGVFNLVGTLTDPQFSVVLRALAQTGNANQLSSPRVTTVNNQQAQIRVVKEYIYPSDYETTPPTTNETGGVITPGIVTPKSFVTRNIGIILDVTPSAGSDRRTIHMTIVPEVSELVDWINYGVKFGDNELPIVQPLFQNRTLTTSVVVNDGDTVVLGGMMKDVISSFKDKVPLLGDLPLLGRMFRSEGESREKRNLLIFVTADLITPSGVEWRNADMESMEKDAESAAAAIR